VRPVRGATKAEPPTEIPEANGLASTATFTPAAYMAPSSPLTVVARKMGCGMLESSAAGATVGATPLSDRFSMVWALVLPVQASTPRASTKTGHGCTARTLPHRIVGALVGLWLGEDAG
jgi:hypothetical protein